MCKCGEIHFEKKFAETYNRYADRGEVENCLIQRFMEEQAKLPPWRRSKTVMISCSCKRCSPYSL